MEPLDVVLLLGAGLAAGAINSVAGGGTLASFPALLAVGLDPRVANMTSAVALWPGSLSAALGYREDLRDARALWIRLAVPSLAGGGLGSALLLWTPSSVFKDLVPLLIFAATVLFLAQERWRPRVGALQAPSPRGRVLAFVAQFAVSVYGGYFGAGMGILLLAILGLLGVGDIHRANGLKNTMAVLVNGVAIIGFAISGMVSWSHAAVTTAGAIAGGFAGARIARRLDKTLVRRIVVGIGIVLTVVTAIRLWG